MTLLRALFRGNLRQGDPIRLAHTTRRQTGRTLPTRTQHALIMVRIGERYTLTCSIRVCGETTLNVELPQLAREGNRVKARDMDAMR
jgi:hypothetical protein